MSVLKSNVLPLDIPECARGVGDVILKSDSTALINGVRIAPCALWPDDRGYFLEVMRSGTGLAQHYAPESTQVSAALSYPGTIKAFHYHQFQSDLWVPASGMFQVALVDLRRESQTFGRKNTMYVGTLRPWQILIPPGVGHGYKVVGTAPGLLVYVTDRFYDPADEGRVRYDDERIAYDWEIQHK